MYTTINYKTKKALKDAIANGIKVGAYQPGGLFPSQTNGEITLEGPHYPAPHTWYAQATLVNGIITKVR